jgi:hypothetical protein
MTKNYFHACACFNCRKSFKRNLQRDKEGNTIQPKCPDCGKETKMMGRKFKSPTKSDDKQWKKIEILIQAGFRVGAHGVPELGRYPDKLDQVPDFIRKNWKKRCAGCIRVTEKDFGSCPHNSEEIEKFIKRWFR